MKSLEDALARAPPQQGKVLVITGTTSGTGFAAARELGRLGATVIMLNRASPRADSAVAQLREELPDATFDPIECDLQDIASVQAAAKAIMAKYPEVDCLCNNAGVMALPDAATKDGFDVQMQTNFLSHFLLTRELWPALQAAAAARGEARVINHSSIRRTGPKLQAKFFEKQGGKLGGNGSATANYVMHGPRWRRYQQSKLASTVFATALRDKITEADLPIKSLCAHPGFATTNLLTRAANEGGYARGLIGKFINSFAQSSDDGVAGIVRCVVDPDAKHGDFFGPAGVGLTGTAQPLKFRRTDDAADSKLLLWTQAEKAMGAFPLSG